MAEHGGNINITDLLIIAFQIQKPNKNNIRNFWNIQLSNFS